ncbi:MAG: hypothetical protein SNF33_07405 [Candidatus Algichlamydia australiensis]|nr:hypothetical protein [Chlamydiales bacterium]
MELIEKLQALRATPVFFTKDAHAHGISSAQLSYYAKLKLIQRIRHGVYKFSDYEEPFFQWEDLIETALSIKSGVICLTSALAVYEITDQLPRQHWIAIDHNTSIKVKPEVRLTRTRNIELGKTEIDLMGTKIPIFDRERTIIDTFRFLGPEIAISSLKSALENKKDPISIPKIQAYAKKFRVRIEPYLMALVIE